MPDAFDQSQHPNANFGWLPNPTATEAVVASLRYQSFAETGLIADDADAFPYRALAKCLGVERLHSRNQGSYGTCVGHGTATGCDITTACEIVVKGEPESWPGLESADAMYGLCRDLSGQLGGGDGSYGGAAAKAVLFGSLHMKKYSDEWDLSAYSGDRARKFARSGVPKALKDFADDHKFRAATRVNNCDELQAAMANGYGVNICSGQGFASVRDEDGFCRASGSWSHSMSVIGYRKDRRGFLIWNSWGDNWVTGPTWPSDMPHGSFWCEWNTMQRILGQKDSFSYSNYQGFPAQKIDWNNLEW